MSSFWNDIERSRIIANRMKEIVAEGEDLEEVEEAVEKLGYCVEDFLDDLRDSESYLTVLTRAIYEPWLDQNNLQKILYRILRDPLDNKHILIQFQFIYCRLDWRNHPTESLKHLAEGLRDFYEHSIDDEYFVPNIDGSFPSLKFSEYPQIKAIYDALVEDGGVPPLDFGNLMT